MRIRPTILTILGAVAASSLLVVAPAQAAPSVEIRPETLTRGPDVVGPHLEGNRTIVDDGLRIRLKEPVLELLGASGPAYVAVVGTGQGEDARVARVRRNGSVRTIAAGFPGSLTLSADGSEIAISRGTTAKRTKILIKSARGGAILARHAFPGSVSVLDVTDSRALLGSFGPDRTLTWDYASDQVSLVVRKAAYVADAVADRFAYFTADPYFGGCSAVATLSAPRQRLLTSCEERVETFNPNGNRMATVDLLADGLGPNMVWVRKMSGRLLTSYTADYFGTVSWESNVRLLLETYRSGKTTTARCVKSRCEAAEKVRRARVLRPTAR